MKVREEYQNMSRQELLDRVYELGNNYQTYSGSCSQSVVAALSDVIGFDDVLVKVATSSYAGQARQCLGTCGALVGGTMVLDYFTGRPKENMSAEERIQFNADMLTAATEVALQLYDRFFQEHKSTICTDMHRLFFGRTYWFPDPDDAQKFREAGNSEKCADVVGKAARWVLEILLDEGEIEL
ncbi:C-GCAxxG-C-C family protein [Chloroflexota bacterium]